MGYDSLSAIQDELWMRRRVKSNGGLMKRPGKFAGSTIARSPRKAGLDGVLLVVLPIVGGLLLIASGIIHFDLWSTGYSHVPTIGDLFLIQGTLAVLLGIAVVVVRRWTLYVAGALLLAGTVAGLLVSVNVSLFGFRDSMSAPDAVLSLVIECVGVVVLVVLTLITRPRAWSL
jgi:hypothetical protein